MSTGRTLVILHPVQWGITRDEALAALSADRREGATVVSIDLPWDPANKAVDWAALKRLQAEQFQEKVKAHLDRYPDDVVAYFGAAPIPLAMHLGFLLSTWARVEAYQQHHETKAWSYASADRTAVRVEPRNVPKDTIDSPGELVVRVSASYDVAASDTKGVIGDAVSEVDLDFAPRGKDVLASAADTEETAADVVRNIEEIVQRRPRASRLHIFVAGPVGLVFRIGSKLNPTVIPTVALYQYDRSATPRYTNVLELQDGAISAGLTAEERALATQVRAAWRTAFEEVVAWARLLGRTAAAGSWLTALGLGVDEAVLPPTMASLPGVAHGKFKDSTFADTTDVPDGFRYDRDERRWEVGDAMLVAIGRRLPSEAWPRAARLFFLHEAVHLDAQKVTNELSFRIGVRHPMIAEDFDFRADAWATVHELSCSWERGASKDPVRWLRDSIDVNTEVIWSFVPAHEAARRLELRRLRRFTTWYWQLIRVRESANLASAIAALLDKPSVSLSGPPVHSAGGRTYVLLDRPYEVDPEAAVLERNRLMRHGNSEAVDLKAAFTGLANLDGRPLRRALDGLHDLVEGRG